MCLYLSLILVALANNINIPPAVWWLFGIDIFCRIGKGTVDLIEKRYKNEERN